MATDLGKIGIVMKGAYNSANTYEVLDAVSYGINTYIAKQAVPANTLPTNTTYWQPALVTTEFPHAQHFNGSNKSVIHIVNKNNNNSGELSFIISSDFWGGVSYNVGIYIHTGSSSNDSDIFYKVLWGSDEANYTITKNSSEVTITYNGGYVGSRVWNILNISGQANDPEVTFS